MKLIKLALMVGVLCGGSFLNAQITVTNVDTPEELVEDVLVGGGVTISNIEFNHTVPDAAIIQPMVGFFDAAGTDFPIGSGVLLATGNVALAVGPNDDGGATDGTDVPEEYGMDGDFDDADLTAIGTEDIYHEAVIEFDFIPEGDSVVFNYVFASEEYLEFVDAGFNDVFGFFISGPGFDGPYTDGAENIALIPGTTTPVSIDNVNNEDFPELYVNNDGGLHVQYDGYTVMLTARAEVICGETYHIKLAIGDAGDDILDSGVFLEAGSFTSTGISVEIASVLGEDAIVEGCDSAVVSFIRPTAGDSVELLVEYGVGGTADNGIDYDFIDGEVLFPEGEDTVIFWIAPFDDGLDEGTETIIITVVTVNDCGDTVVTEATIEIVDSSPPELIATDTIINCALDSLLISVEIEGGTPEFDIIWDTGDDDLDVWVPGDISGTTTYSIEVTDACGMFDEVEINVTLDPLDPPLITFDSDSYEVCLGDSVTIDAAVTPSDSPDMVYEWEPGGEITEDITITPDEDGWFTLTADDGCNSSTDSLFIDIIEINAEETITGEICLGDCLGSILLEASGGTAPYTYSIDACDSFGDIGSFVGLCAGDYEICIEDADGCRYTSVLVVPSGLEPADATITPPGDFCLNGEPESLIVATVGGTFVGEGMLGGVFNPSVAGVGDHEIIYTVGEPCGDADTIIIKVHPLPIVSFVGDTLQGCVSHKVSFENTGVEGVTCLWNFGDGGSSNYCGTVNHVYEISGTYDVSLTITDEQGCSNTSNYSNYVTAFPAPNASFVFSPHPTTTFDTEVDFTDLSFFAFSWEWNFNGMGSSNDQNPTFTFPQVAGVYPVDLWVETEFGCKDSITKNVVINEPILVYVPNVFTPDGDDFNEYFLPYLSGLDEYDYHIMIFNRWGEVLFESHDMSVGWNGTHGNRGLVEDGVYIWTISVGDLATDQRYEYNGHVTVLK